MMESENIEDSSNCETLAKLAFDTIKENDLKFIFEVLSSPPENRTISDLDSLVKIMMHIEQVKKLQNMSAVFFLCKKMTLVKFKTKDIIYESRERANSLYIILSGKVAFYRKSNDYFESDEVIFLNSGSCFGNFYDWKINFLPISIDETLLAVAPEQEVNKIPMHLSYERQVMLEELRSTDLFTNVPMCPPSTLNEFSKLLILNKVPCGSFLIREGETPKALFFIMKGIVKKIICEEERSINIKRYSQGEFCLNNLDDPLTFALITETVCEIVVIPKKALKLINSSFLNSLQKENSIDINKEFLKKKEWETFKQKCLTNFIGNTEKPFQARWKR